MEIYNNNLEYVYKFNENSSNKNSTKSASNYDRSIFFTNPLFANSSPKMTTLL